MSETEYDGFRCGHVTDSDAAMLASLSTWFRMRENHNWKERHSFNDGDVADMLDRVRRRIEYPT